MNFSPILVSPIILKEYRLHISNVHFSQNGPVGNLEQRRPLEAVNNSKIQFWDFIELKIISE